MRFALAAVAAVVLLPASAQAAEKGVKWPEARDYTPGETVRVKVAAKRAVTVVFVRERANGDVQRVLTRRTVRRGSVSLRFGNPGRYALRVGDATRRYQTTADCDENGDSAELRLGTTSVAAGGVLAYRVVNTSRNYGCVMSGLGYGLERQLADGSWSPINAGEGVPAVGFRVAPWAPLAKQAQIPAGAEPGTYRLSDHVLRRDAGSASETIGLTAQFTVTA